MSFMSIFSESVERGTASGSEGGCSQSASCAACSRISSRQTRARALRSAEESAPGAESRAAAA